MSDYISRENAIAAAIEILEGLGYHMKHNERFFDEVEAAFDEVETADVAPVRHGRWTYLVSLNGDECDKWKCSECGHYTRNGADRNFCPNCGSRMDKDGDGDV